MGRGPVEGALREGAGEPGLTLIETLRREPAGIARIEAHLARLARSAAALGWGCDIAAARAALAAAAPGGPARLRLTLDAAGRIAVAAAPLPPAARRWRAGPAAQRLDSADPWLALKSSRRPHHDAARAALEPGLDEAVLVNERGEVCEGTITSVFFHRGQGLRTPPLACGLLPGVLRAELLARGACAEEVLAAADLPRVRLWLGNSLRGLVAADWIAG